MAKLAQWPSRVLVILIHAATISRVCSLTITQIETLVGGSLAGLTQLDLSGRGLSGPIPPELGSLTNLTKINFDDNALSGPIPTELAQLSNLSAILLGFNSLSGPIPPELCTLPALTFFSLHNNLLSGPIPPGLGDASRLTYISLAGNSLTGSIPPELANLASLTTLYLNVNSLSGPIPEGLGALENLTVLELGHNQLSGRIPPSLLRFGNESFADNPGLCYPSKCTTSSFPSPAAPVNAAPQPAPEPPQAVLAPAPLATNASIVSISQPPQSPPSSNGRIAVILSTIGGASVSLLLIAACSLFFCWRKRRRQQRSETDSEKGTDQATLPRPLLPLGGNLYTLNQLQVATSNFSDACIIGKGSFGVVYRAKLFDGSVVAVKRLQERPGKRLIEERSWLTEVEALGKVRHRNLVPLLGVCTEGGERLLVFDFFPGGNLRARLHESPRVLPWADRARVARGVCRGLTYLHNDISPPMLHRDIKAANILLAGEGSPIEAFIADFGLARLVQDAGRDSSTLVKGTVPYMAPEYLHGGASFLTPKCDVYSFGMLLLELVSGRPVVQQRAGGVVVRLLEFAGEVIREGRILELVDPRMGSEYDSHEAQRFIQVAMTCLRKDPSARPSMERVQAQLFGERLASEADVAFSAEEAWESPSSFGVTGSLSSSSSLQHARSETGSTVLVASRFLHPR